jgi:hypothetical protein
LDENGEYELGMRRLQRTAEAINSREELCRKFKMLIQVKDIAYLFQVKRRISYRLVLAFFVLAVTIGWLY